MSISLNLKRCKGCAICVEFCPKKVLHVNEIGKVAIENESLCIKCKQCEEHCPDYAIFVQK